MTQNSSKKEFIIKKIKKFENIMHIKPHMTLTS